MAVCLTENRPTRCDPLDPAYNGSMQTAFHSILEPTMARHAIVISVATHLLFATATKAADPVAVDARRTAAEQVLRTAGVRGGLIVHVGCGDGRLYVVDRKGQVVCLGERR